MSNTSDAPRITLDAGGRRAQLTVVWTTLTVAAAAFAVGVPALVWAGQAAGLGPVAWLVPLVVDAGLTVAGLAAAVRHSQHRRAGLETTMMAGLTVLSMAVQAWHAWEVGAPVVAVVVAAAAPLTVLASTHAAFRAVLSEPPARGRKKVTGKLTAAVEQSDKAPSSMPARAKTRKPAPASQPTAVTMMTPRPEPTSALGELVPEILAGRLSQRQAATMAGVSRHAVASAVAEATTEEAA